MNIIEKLSKLVKNMSEKLSDMVSRVGKLKMTNLNQFNPNIDIVGGKTNYVDYNQGTFFPQPMINFETYLSISMNQYL